VSPPDRRRIIVALSGSSAPHYGVRLLEVLGAMADVETHAIISAGAQKTIAYELGRDPASVEDLADVVHDERNLAASIASGTFVTEGMVIAPCSIKTLSAVANSFNDNLLARAGDVCLKERRRLVLVVRETPLHAGHLRLMLRATEMGAVILPPVPAFYHLPSSLDEVIDHTVTKVLDQFGIDAGLVRRWEGIPEAD
jgi:polyprenyl P-hydroxybenzoate/phenylacrylic acid decarboxylase-like protein